VLFLVELDHVKSGQPLTPDQGRAFIEQVILPTLALAERLAADGKIVAGGPVAGRIALRLIIDARSALEADSLVTSLPIWPLAETRLTPLVSFADRRQGVLALLERVKSDQRPPDRAS
jgi:muconolactone delta-isomerase